MCKKESEEREWEREREKKQPQTKKKKKERTVIFGESVFLHFNKQRRESTSVVTETPQNKNKSSSNLTYK